jgi:hypothetical protein
MNSTCMFGTLTASEVVAGAQPVLEQKPARRQLGSAERTQLPGQRHALARGVLDGAGHVVLQALADAGQVGDDPDRERLEAVGVADPRQHQKLRRVHRAGGDHHLAPDLEDRGRAVPDGVDADRPRSGELDPGHARAGQDGEIGAWTARVQVGPRGVPANAAVNVALGDVDALLPEGIVVLDPDVASLHAGLEEGLVHRMVGLAGLDLHRAGAAAIGVAALVEGLRALEVRQAGRVAPAFEAAICPVVVVPGIAADPVQPVDRGGPAEHAAARLVDLAVLQMRFRLGVVVPVEAVVHQRQAERRRHVDMDVVVARTRFDQQDGVTPVLRQPAGERAPRRSRAHDDEVEGLTRLHFPRCPPLPQSRILLSEPAGLKAEVLLRHRTTRSPPRGEWAGDNSS